MIQQKQVTVCGLEFTFSIESSNGAPLDLQLTVEPAPELPDTYLVQLAAHTRGGESFTVRDLSITWSVPAVDMHSMYAGPPAPDEIAKLPYWWIRKQSCANT